MPFLSLGITDEALFCSEGDPVGISEQNVAWWHWNLWAGNLCKPLHSR